MPRRLIELVSNLTLGTRPAKPLGYTELVFIWPVSGLGMFALLRLSYGASGLLCMQLTGADVDCIACISLCKYCSVQVLVS